VLLAPQKCSWKLGRCEKFTFVAFSLLAALTALLCTGGARNCFSKKIGFEMISSENK